tara:strand:- start:1701 stop:1880 length:180 start_codon:yes stop_codon:yes gene_type:complete
VKKRFLWLALIFVSCSTNIKSLIKDVNGNGHYYEQSPIESVELWCFIHEQYEKITINNK